MQRIQLKDGREVHFKTAGPDDVPNILALYHEVYSGKYSLPEATNEAAALKKINDPNYFWTLAAMDGRIIGSVIFAIDPINKLGKTYAAAVLSEFRGQDVMRHMVLQGLERLTKLTRTCDAIYATTRTVSVAPQVVLEHLGFHPMGIFPNVRKVKSFETHGLEIYFREGSLEMRRKRPRLVPEVEEFYRIVRDILKLEEHETVEIEPEDPRKMGEPIRFSVDRDAVQIRRRYDRYQDLDMLDTVFFPFHDANLLFTTEDHLSEIFMNFNEADGHAVIVGYRIRTPDLRHVLLWMCEAAAAMGMRYIELLVNAFQPEVQRNALDARFLPCAYHPSMRLNELGQREDYVVFSRSFESLDFMDLHLVDTNRRFLDAFMKCWYEMLVRCQPDFDDERWRIG